MRVTGVTVGERLSMAPLSGFVLPGIIVDSNIDDVVVDTSVQCPVDITTFLGPDEGWVEVKTQLKMDAAGNKEAPLTTSSNAGQVSMELVKNGDEIARQAPPMTHNKKDRKKTKDNDQISQKRDGMRAVDGEMEQKTGTAHVDSKKIISAEKEIHKTKEVVTLKEDKRKQDGGKEKEQIGCSPQNTEHDVAKLSGDRQERDEQPKKETQKTEEVGTLEGDQRKQDQRRGEELIESSSQETGQELAELSGDRQAHYEEAKMVSQEQDEKKSEEMEKSAEARNPCSEVPRMDDKAEAEEKTKPNEQTAGSVMTQKTVKVISLVRVRGTIQDLVAMHRGQPLNIVFLMDQIKAIHGYTLNHVPDVVERLMNEAIARMRPVVKPPPQKSELHTEPATQATSKPSAESHEKVSAAAVASVQSPAHGTTKDANKSTDRSSMPAPAALPVPKSTPRCLSSPVASADQRPPPRSSVSAVERADRQPSPGRDRARRRDQSPSSSTSSDGDRPWRRPLDNRREGSARRCRSRPLAERKRRKRSHRSP